LFYKPIRLIRFDFYFTLYTTKVYILKIRFSNAKQFEMAYEILKGFSEAINKLILQPQP